MSVYFVDCYLIWKVWLWDLLWCMYELFFLTSCSVYLVLWGGIDIADFLEFCCLYYQSSGVGGHYFDVLIDCRVVLDCVR